MIALLQVIIPILIKLLSVIGALLLAINGNANLYASEAATTADFATLYAGWTAIGSAGFGAGEAIDRWLQSRSRTAAVGRLDIDRLKKIIAMLLQIISALSPDKAAAAHAIVASSLDVEDCEKLGVKRI